MDQVDDFDLDFIDDIRPELSLHSNSNNNEFSGDPEHEMNNADQVYIQYDLEPGQMIFIDANNSNEIPDEGNTDSLVPAMFIDYEGPDNALFRVLNLDTQ